MVRIKRFRKVFQKNFILILALVLSLTIASASVFIIFKQSAQKEKVNLLEIEESGRTEAAFTRTINAVASACIYFSTKGFVIEQENPSNGFLQIYTFEKNLETLRATFNAIESIKVIDKATGFSVRSGDNVSFNAGRLYGQSGDVKIFENTSGETPSVFMHLDANEVTYLKNSVFLGINSEYFAESILNENDNKKQYIVDKNGTILVSSEAQRINGNISEIYGNKIDYGTSKSHITKINGEKKIITTDKIESFDVYIVSVADISIYKEIEQSGTISTILAIFFFAISAIIIVWLLMKVTYKPVEEILTQVGDMAFFDKKTTNEVQYISKNIKRLQSTNNELSELVDEKIEELTHQHIAALQAQICPHFVYNTLDSINWIVYKILHKRDNDVSKAIKNMSLLYKSAMNINELFRSIREEKEFTDYYTEILEVRNPEMFSIIWDIDEELLECNILKLSIQPLIENISNHAIGKETEHIDINVSIKREGPHIRVTVTDNGVGMSEERLKEVCANINNFVESEHHLGIRNVNERLQLLYGEEYGININSIKGKGTTCSFIYPIG